jgi:hypothetical protein
VAALDRAGDMLVETSWAPRTLQMLEIGMSHFRAFRAEIKMKGRDCTSDPIEVKRFISFLFLKKKAPSTINYYVTAVSNWHKVKGLDDPCASFIVKRALKGVARTGTTPDTWEPMTIDLLTAICEKLKFVCYSDHEAKMFKSAFCLAFFGLFRIGEFVCANKGTAHKGVLMINDLAFRQNSMKVVI